MKLLTFLIISGLTFNAFGSSLKIYSLKDVMVKKNTSSTDLFTDGEDLSCKIQHDVSPKDRPIKANTGFEVITSKINTNIKNKNDVLNIFNAYGLSGSALLDISNNVDLSNLNEQNLRRLNIISEGFGIVLNNIHDQSSSLTFRIKSQASNKTYSVNCFCPSAVFNAKQVFSELYESGVLSAQ